MQGYLRRSAADALDMMLGCKRDFSLAQPLHEIVETEISRDRAAMRRCCGSGDISGLSVVTPAAILYDMVVHALEQKLEG